MIGQSHINYFLDNAYFSTCPKSILLIGPVGCGKHLFIQNLSDKFDIVNEDITDIIDDVFIGKVDLSFVPNIYYIDLDKFTNKKQNIILKFIEEPPENSIIILIASNENNVINTIYNRCYRLIFEPYCKDMLLEFAKSNNIVIAENHIKYLHTPGDVLSYNKDLLDTVLKFCNKIFLNIRGANFANCLTLIKYIDFKDNDKNKFPYRLIIECLLEIAVELFQINAISFNMFKLTQSLLKDSKYKQDYKKLFEHFLLTLSLESIE